MQGADRTEIEKTTYLASLVSDPHVVDPMLDKIRLITARGEGVQLVDTDRKEIHAVQKALTDYLINKDKINSFTSESLHEKLIKHFSPEYKDAEKTLRRQLATALILPFFIASALFFALSSFDRNLQLVSAIPAFLASQYAGLLWLFWSARRSLVKALQKSLSLTIAAIIILVLGGIIFVALAFLPDIAHLPLFLYSGPLPLYIAGFYLLYLGAVTYTKQATPTNSIWERPKTVTAIAFALYFAIWLIPHRTQVEYEIIFDTAVAAFGAGSLLCAAASILLFSSARQVTKRYTNGLRYMAISFAIMAVTNIGTAITAFVSGTAPVGSSAIFPTYVLAGTGFSVAFIMLYVSAYTIKLRLID